MQEQQNFYPSSDIDNTKEEIPAAFKEREINSDPREQPESREDTYRSYEEGYQDQSEQERWFQQGEKLRGEPNHPKKANGITALVFLLGIIFIASGLFSGNHNWIIPGAILIPLVFIVSIIVRRWRVMITPMPTRTFQIMAPARLAINSNGGAITIRRGEDNVVNVNATKRASGINPNTEQIEVLYNQQGNLLDIDSQPDPNHIQFSIRTVDFEITVPQNCDIQLHTASGRIEIEGTRGQIRAETGNGRIHAHNLRGRIAMKTGNGRIEVDNLQGKIDLHTGSSRITAHNLAGETNLKTGSSRIELDSIHGQLTAQTGSGHIEVSRSELSGYTLLKTGSGSISFDGSLDKSGSYDFKTGSGGIDLSLPADASFRLDAKTGSGRIRNEFGPNEVGDGAQARIKLKTGSGGIRIHRSL